MKTRSVAILSALTLLLTSACTTLGMGSASPVIDRIQKTGELRVGMAGDYPPLNVLDKYGTNIGLEPDLAGALAATLDVKLVVVNKPFGELLAALEAGEVDAVMSGVTMTPARNMSIAFAGPYFISGKAVLTRSELLARANSATELDRASLSLVTLENTTSQSFVERAVPNAKLTTVPTYADGVEMVISGKADAMVADYPVCVTTVLRNSGAGLIAAVSPFTFEPIGIALPANDALFLNLVQNYLHSLEGTGLLTQLRAKWFDDASWLLQLP
jgi:polar amino acid transport system substrate-binding protein